MIFRTVGRKVCRTLETLGIPRSTLEHLVNAQKETLLAIRSLLDAAIEDVESWLKPESEKGVEKVEIQ
jgi:alanyl-tRNA synthetase